MPAALCIHHQDGQWKRCRAQGSAIRIQQRRQDVSEPDVAAFVVIAILLAATLVWATLIAWRRSGASESPARRAAIIVGVDSVAWMALTWFAATSGILQQWDRRPPPFALIILGVVSVSLILAFGGVGTRLARHIPLWALVAIQSFRL